MADRLAAFLEATEPHDPKLVKQLRKIEDDAGEALRGILDRFDCARSGALDDGERELAARVLTLLHRPSPRGLELLATVLGYFDVNANRVLEFREAALAVEVLELFCKADSKNETLSNKELEVLQAVLAHIDGDGDGVIDPAERTRLRDQLWQPEEFLAEQKRSNPLVREVLGLD